MKLPTDCKIDGRTVYVDWARGTATVSIRRSDGRVEHHLLTAAHEPNVPLELLPIRLCDRIKRDRGAPPSA